MRALERRRAALAAAARGGRAADPPVTVIRSRRVRPGQEATFEDIMRGFIAAAARFPGHEGATILRPIDRADPEYRVVFRFDHLSNLQRWDESVERKQWLRRMREVTESEASQELTGLEAFFPPQPDARPPSRHRMALLTWAVACPLATLIFALFGPWLMALPLPARTLLLTGVMIASMTYVLMPPVTRRLRPWLYPVTG